VALAVSMLAVFRDFGGSNPNRANISFVYGQVKHHEGLLGSG